ncbi:tRNA pseudouridine synthase Pus10 [Octopus bimaculoides]|nr:tRNA pseudouridine synthase Pus10 [Octopus bimaculoides]|eukprot:XP_014768473.1 PREDICTED: putative tRNA pseudouridine synthase Pus10 [Octopus bimaculoides]
MASLFDEPEIVKFIHGICGEDSEIQPEEAEKICICCLGILQQFCSDTFTQKIIEHVKSSGYIFSNYLCSLMLPVSLIVRQHSVYLHLRDEFVAMYHGISDDDIPAVKEVWKWQNGPILADALAAPFNMKSPFELNITFTYPHSNKECGFLTDIHPDIFRKRKTKKGDWEMFSRANVAKAVSETVNSIYQKVCKFPPLTPMESCICDSIRCQHDSVFVAGRYNKYSRFLSQTPWLIEGVKKHETSVQELICNVLNERYEPVECKFSASGREDVDVKMLGNGRPFVIELINSKRSNFTAEDFVEMKNKINESTKSIFVRDLQAVSREEIGNLKEGEIDKTKSYSALCWSQKPLTEEQLSALSTYKDLAILQKTPIRVLHRRPLASRKRLIHFMSATKVNDNHFRLSLSTQAGTYVKEFVHGDFGRTQPNLSCVFKTDCDILELDVVSVDIDWPKRLDQ